METTRERKHVLDLIWAYTARQSVSKEAREQLDEMPGPSLTRTVGQLRSLAERTRGLGELRAIPTQIFKWENPAQTVSFLVVYTGVCLHPNVLAALPLFCVLVGIFVPNYARKFPTNAEYIPRPAAPSELSEQEELVEAVVAAPEVAERDIVAAVRAGQASIDKICAALDKFDQFRAGPGNFVEPQTGCALFVVLLGLLLNTGYVASFVSLRWLLVCGGWLATVGSYPPLKRALDEMEPIQLQLTLVPRLVAWAAAGVSFDDDAEFSREVEIFELQKQGLTPRIWDTVLFSPHVYSGTSPLRLSQQYPPGAASLTEISPPRDWVFREDSAWAEDADAAGWVKDRRVVGVSTDGAWAYDVDLGWRRRRLVKQCFYCPS